MIRLPLNPLDILASSIFAAYKGGRDMDDFFLFNFLPFPLDEGMTITNQQRLRANSLTPIPPSFSPLLRRPFSDLLEDVRQLTTV